MFSRIRAGDQIEVVFRVNRVGTLIWQGRTKRKRQPWEWIAAMWSFMPTNGTRGSKALG
ncbi:hypothetical protein M622_06320 [Thauera terpenica 58Eu]|uniref:Uncharacterized protein n=1 Tax=Thauera terpenica 58Eu TaxID=1348657 RepID=S9ZHY4_9RHOO|nr:hypothetical protein M622_06320 [Thauera terpenica 58Eu]